MKRAYVGLHQLVTMRGSTQPRIGASMSELDVINDAAVIVEIEGPGHETIQSVGRYGELRDDVAACDEEVDCDGLGIPAFVDAHTHLVWGGHRWDDFERRCQGMSYRQIAESGGGILSTVRQTRSSSPGDLLDAATQRAFDMVALGTGVVEIKSGYGLDRDTEVRMLGVAGRLKGSPFAHVERTYLGLHAVAPEFDEREAYVSFCLDEVLPEIAAQRLVSAVDIFVEEGYFTEEDATRLAAVARERRLALRLHVDQMAQHRGAELAARLGAKTADHLEHTDDAGIRAMADAGVIPILLPMSVYGLGLDHYPDARAMIDAGLPVVLATDFNPGSSPCPSMPMVHSTACRYMSMSPAECLTASTINAAHALGIADRFGSIEPGKQLVMAILDTNDYRDLAYSVGNNLVAAMCGLVDERGDFEPVGY